MTFPDIDGTIPLAADTPGALPDAARRVLVKLLSRRFVTSTHLRDGDGWKVLLAYRDDLSARLADLYYTLEVDEDRQVAFTRRVEGDDIPRTLTRQEPRLSRDASFLLLFLRQEWAFADPDDDELPVTRAQLEEFLGAYREDDDRDGAKFRRRVDAAITAVDGLDLLRKVKGSEHLYLASPAIVSLVGIDEVTRLEEIYQRGAAADGDSPDDRQLDADETQDEEVPA